MLNRIPFLFIFFFSEDVCSSVKESGANLEVDIIGRSDRKRKISWVKCEKWCVDLEIMLVLG
jgi:hypothetical protein